MAHGQKFESFEKFSFASGEVNFPAAFEGAERYERPLFAARAIWRISESFFGPTVFGPRNAVLGRVWSVSSSCFGGVPGTSPVGVYWNKGWYASRWRYPSLTRRVGKLKRGRGAESFGVAAMPASAAVKRDASR